RLDAGLRPEDVVGLYGGEEFLLIFPGCDLSTGTRRANEIRQLVCKQPVSTPGGTLSVTISMGVTVTSLGRDHKSADSLREADVSLYAAKNNGRNRVEVFSPAARGTAAG